MNSTVKTLADVVRIIEADEGMAAPLPATEREHRLIAACMVDVIHRIGQLRHQGVHQDLWPDGLVDTRERLQRIHQHYLDARQKEAEAAELRAEVTRPFAVK